MPSPRTHTTHLVAATLASVLALAGCAQGAIAPGAGSTPTTAATAFPGLTTNFSLYIHCGVRYAIFDGDDWEALAPIPSISPYVNGKDGTSGSRNEIAGEMVRLSSTEARFTTTDDPVGVVVQFVRLTTPIPGCA